MNLATAGFVKPVKLNSKNMKITPNWFSIGMQKLKDGTVPPLTWWLEKGHSHLLALLQLSTKSEIKCQTLIATKNFKQKEI